VPIGPSSVHLVLNGLIGILLGWLSFPAIFLGLSFQALLFQFGGFTTLGVNTFNMAFPAVVVYYLFKKGVKSKSIFVTGISGFLSGLLGVMFSALLVAISLITTGKVFLNVAKLIVGAHIPVMIIEGIVTCFCMIFLKKVKPEILGGKNES
jgi:cobalt/nickel transport system permease protein